jgi:hypothetical protein
VTEAGVAAAELAGIVRREDRLAERRADRLKPPAL